LAKGVAQRLLGFAGMEVRRKRRSPGALIAEYERLGRIPWTTGYAEAKEAFISQTMATPNLMSAFADGRALPLGYGIGLDERCIEYPWFFAMEGVRRGTLLDAGSALNHEFLVTRVELHEREMTVFTLGPEEYCFWKRGISYSFGDIRRSPFRDRYFESIACISTLEHIGLDNTIYGAKTMAASGQDGFVLAMKEMRRLLAPGGTLSFTVPFGRYENHGWFQQFDEPMLRRAMEAFGPSIGSRVAVYRYSPSGWALSSPSESQDCRYQAPPTRGAVSNRMGADPKPSYDGAAAARAVACVRLVSGPTDDQ
jgi:SAM-dependent methyltransferase